MIGGVYIEPSNGKWWAGRVGMYEALNRLLKATPSTLWLYGSTGHQTE